MTRFVNLTPHDITILKDDDSVLKVIESSGVIARCATSREKVDEVDGVTINRSVFGEVSGLPEPAPDTIYIVSVLTAQAVPERADVFITDDAVRDEAGRIIGCRALAHIR